MTYKKTWLSYLLWAVYTCLTGVMLANYAILFWQKKINDAVNYGTVLFVFCIFVLVPGIYFMMRKISGKVGGKYDISSHTKSLWETFIALSIFFAGLLYRVSFYLQNTEHLIENSYYQLAMVKVENIEEPMAHGISYLYTMCLSFVLSFLGNKIFAAVWLQILLQMVTILLAFFTVRRLAGSIPACMTMFVLAVSSVYTEQILTTTPESLFFILYLLGMFIVGGYVKNDCASRGRKSSAVLGALLSGFIIGFLTYLDVVSLTLFVLLFGLVSGVRREKTGTNKVQKGGNAGFSVMLILAAIAAGCLSFAAMLVLNAYSYYEEIETLAEMLAAFYREHFLIDYVFYRTDDSVIECFMLVILAALLIMSYWNRRKVQNASPWICLMLLLAPTPLTAIGILPYQVCSIFIWSVLAGIGVQQSLIREKKAPVKQKATEEPPAETISAPVKESSPESVPAPAKESSPESVPALAKESSSESVPALTEAPAGKPRFLENPLPLPKKHEKRTMDYQYEISEEQMKFDFEVNENDDFDIV